MEYKGKTYSSVVIESPEGDGSYIFIEEGMNGYVQSTAALATNPPKAVERAFIGGSMWGWSTPASNPYDSSNQR